jgi:hypothetical protein
VAETEAPIVELLKEVRPLARQLEWLDVLRLLPQVEVYLWRPSDWDGLVEVLTGMRQAA